MTRCFCPPDNWWDSVEDAFGCGQFHLGEQFQGALPRLLFGDFLVKQDGLHDLIAAGEHGVEGGHGLLEDHGDVVATVGAQLLFGKPGEVYLALLAVKEDLTAGNAARWIGYEAHDGQAGHRLSRTRFAHDADGFSLIDGKTHVVDRRDLAVFRGESRYQVPDVDEFLHNRGIVPVSNLFRTG